MWASWSCVWNQVNCAVVSMWRKCSINMQVVRLCWCSLDRRHSISRESGKKGYSLWGRKNPAVWFCKTFCHWICSTKCQPAFSSVEFAGNTPPFSHPSPWLALFPQRIVLPLHLVLLATVDNKYGDFRMESTISKVFLPCSLHPFCDKCLCLIWFILFDSNRDVLACLLTGNWKSLMY